MTTDQQSEVADEVVDAPTGDEELKRSFESVGTALVEINRLQAGMAALRQNYPLDVVVDVSTKAGLAHAIAGRAAWRSTKTALEKKRQEAKAPILGLGARLDTLAGELRDQLQAGQDYFDGPIKGEEQRKEAEREAREQAERDRVTALEARLQDIYDVAGRAVGLTSEQILKKFAMLDALEIDDSFFEFKGRAAEAKEKTLARLIDLAARAKESEERAEQARRDAEEVARLRLEKEQRDAADARERQQREATEAAERRQREDAATAEKRARDAEAARLVRRDSFYTRLNEMSRGLAQASSEQLRHRLYLLSQMTVPDVGADSAEAADRLRVQVEELQATEEAARKREEAAIAAQIREMNMGAIALLTATAEKLESFDPSTSSVALADGRAMVDGVRAQLEAFSAELTEEKFGSLLGVARAAAAAVNKALNALRERIVALTVVEPPPAPEIQSPPADAVGQTERQDSDGYGGGGRAGRDGISYAGEGHPVGDSDSLSHAHAQAHLPSGIVTCVPVVRDFRNNEPIGELRIDTAALPPSADFVFTLGFMTLDPIESPPGSIPTAPYMGRYQLKAVAVQTDDQYIGYLRQIGKLQDVDIDLDRSLLAAVVDVMKASQQTQIGRNKKLGAWSVPIAQMTALKTALRKQLLPGGQFYAEDGTLINADGTRSTFDDVDE